jgi:ABC-type oligopeptide transport system substrate-binding subunit/class 3 adenylate cyclase
MSDLPEGTVTFLFTDIEGSTELLKQLGDEYAVLLADQRKTLRKIFIHHNGQEVDTQGDSFFVSFPRATEAVKAAVEIQRALAEHTWPENAEVCVRMGLHTGEPLAADEGYVGMDVHRAARIAGVGHGGQVLLSETATPLILDNLPEGVSLKDLGRHRLKDLRRPEWITQLVIDGLESEFPALNSLEALPAEARIEPIAIRSPKFLEEGLTVRRPVFVGREAEMKRLDGHLSRAVEGEGGIVFITGGPGQGKTALLDEFARRAMDGNAEILFAVGGCSAYTGVGDPYHPFREILEMLTGDVELIWKAGKLDRDHVSRIWYKAPSVIRTLIDHGTDLIDVVVHGRQLIIRAIAGLEHSTDWMERLAKLVEGERPLPGEIDQINLYEQYESVLETISEDHPLVLIIDDLQWADSASINLLFYLGRRLAGKRILIVGAYRSEEVSIGRGGRKHPLEKVLTELKRMHGDVWINLGEVEAMEARYFVDELIASEPNRLSNEFRDALYHHTEGNPLFTIEVLRNLQERGDLKKDDNGSWVEGPDLDWDILPARVEGVIEERIGRLEDDLKETLRVASVEGEDFTAQVLARVQEVGEGKVLRRLSREIEKRHRLVRSYGEEKVGENFLNRYQFTHTLIHQYLYNNFGEGERRLLHRSFGEVLENLYSEEIDQVVVQLAHHYELGGNVEKAIHYLQIAGDRARNSYASEEALENYSRLLMRCEKSGKREIAARTLMKMGLTYHTEFQFEKSRVAYKNAFHIWRDLKAREDEPELLTSSHTFKGITLSRVYTLDPTKSWDVHSGLFIRQLFSGLFERTQDLESVPDVAQEWEILDGGMRYVFHLRDDVFWSDGEPVKAEDFEFAWIRVLTPVDEKSQRQPYSAILHDIKGAQDFEQLRISDPRQVGDHALDSFTLEVQLEHPVSYFPHLLSNAMTFPIPKHVVERYGADWTNPEHIVTNGPFQLLEKDEQGSYVFVRNPLYHGRYDGTCDRVQYDLVDPSQIEQLYETNTLDVMHLEHAGFENGRRLRSKYADDFISLPRAGHSFLAFDISQPHLQDVRVREALCLAVDLEKLAHVVTRGFNFPATGGIIPPGIPGHSPGIGFSFDPERARELLAEAGFPNGKDFPLLEAMSHKTPARAVMTEYLRAQWQKILGIDTRWLLTDQYFDILLANPPPLRLTGFVATIPDPDYFLSVGWPAFSTWDHQEFEGLLSEGKASNNQSE